jgi:DNA-binding MarR family transcriptional regulator
MPKSNGSEAVSASEVAQLVVAIYDAASALRRLGDAEAGVAGQTQARWQVMNVAADGGWTVPRVARRLGLQRQSVQRVVDRLRDDGLVELVPNPDHATSPLVQLTPRGADVLAVINSVADRWHRRVAATADPDALRTTARFLTWLRTIADADLVEPDVERPSGAGD